MSVSTDDIVSDAEVERIHANANFGDMAKRGVIDEGVLSYAFGYTTGHTMMQILQEHGLLSNNRSAGYRQQQPTTASTITSPTHDVSPPPSAP